MRKLRKYNGDLGGTHHAVVSAYSAADAVRLINSCGFNVTANGFRNFFVSGLWGDPAEKQLGTVPTIRGLWIRPENDRKAEYIWCNQS